MSATASKQAGKGVSKRRYTSTRSIGDKTFVDYTDLDTLQDGRTAPFESWEADSRALVGILWGFRHDALMVDRPGFHSPLRNALFMRLFDRDASPGGNDQLIADLRAILNEYDPDVTPGAIGARYLTQAEVREAEDAYRAHCTETGEPRETLCAADDAAQVIMHSRWRYALEAHAKARALYEAAREEEAAGYEGCEQVADRLRVRAEEITGKPAALEVDRPLRSRASSD